LPYLVVRDQHFRGRNGSVAPAKTQARPLNEAAPLAISVGQLQKTPAAVDQG
jgi:hypothetical protein